MIQQAILKYLGNACVVENQCVRFFSDVISEL